MEPFFKQTFWICVSLACVVVLSILYYYKDSLKWNNTYSGTRHEEAYLKYPFMVIVSTEYTPDNSQTCIGTLITDNIVMTAAHCVFEVSNVHLILGSENFNNFYIKIIKYEKTVIHPNYNNYTYENDIALVQLSEPVSPKYFPPISLSSMGKEVSIYDRYIVLGWSKGNDEFDDKIRIKIVTVADNTCDSSKDFSTIYTIGNNGLYLGDSGGPLISKNVQIGIVSGFSEYCKVMVYINVPYYCPWIKENAGQNLDCN